MQRIFEPGHFPPYTELDIFLDVIQGNAEKVPVFLSHCHADLKDEHFKQILKLLGALSHGRIQLYIDSQDSSLPKITDVQTAKILQDNISSSKKFIAIVTNGFLESKWCVGELWFATAKEADIAIIIVSEKGEAFTGTEYMNMYPYVSYSDGDESFSDGQPIPKGYYLLRPNEDGSVVAEDFEGWISCVKKSYLGYDRT